MAVVCIGFSWRENFYNSDLRCGSAIVDVNKLKRHLYSAQAKLYFILSIVKVGDNSKNEMLKIIPQCIISALCGTLFQSQIRLCMTRY